MTETFDIAGYCRISVDEELDRDNVSIENQKAIIRDFVNRRFPGSSLTFYEDRDRSGYTFEQREGYQTMRKGLIRHQYDILVVKDFSRFSRRNSRGLVELEDLRDAGVRIISVGDNIDFPNDDDWLKIQFQFLINEMPVTDTSKKVKNVIRRRQADGKWLCAAPYGYIINRQKEFEIVPTEAEIVRQIFDLYNNQGWGYKKIANYLTEQGIPTPRMSEQMRKEAAGESTSRKTKAAWAIVTVQGILDNDFYIGTFRQAKYTRAKINGKDVKRDEDEHIVIENHHQPIIDYRTFATTRSLRQQRSRSYHRRGRSGCSSHHIRVDKLDELLKIYVRRVMEHSHAMLEELNAELARQDSDVVETEQSADHLAQVLEELRQELKATKRQRIRDMVKHPDQEELLAETYDELEADLQKKIEGLDHQIGMLSDKRNTIIQAGRAAKTAMEVFGDILSKETLERNDLELLIERIDVFEDRLEIRLHSDVDTLLHVNQGDIAVNFNSGTENSEKTLIQSSKNHEDKVFRVNVISDGDPLEIYTEKDGGVIFRKYSPMGDLQEFAAQMCESIGSATGHIAAVTDRDSIIALYGIPKRELMDKPNSPELEKLMEQRKNYLYKNGDAPILAADGEEKYHLGAAAPILSQGDLMGCVLLLLGENDSPLQEADQGLVKTAAGFLGKQMEN